MLVIGFKANISVPIIKEKNRLSYHTALNYQAFAGKKEEERQYSEGLLPTLKEKIFESSVLGYYLKTSEGKACIQVRQVKNVQLISLLGGSEPLLCYYA